MADPNTQIDWWIAQAWQEAQGGAANDDLVAWLHENGLTSISSYTILQAALGCTPDEAKNIVFSHPAWAGDVGDLDVANLDYTSDTLEPEPEPDPAFELDDWADEVEEGPVYGEEGYQPITATGPADSPMPEPEQVFAAVDGRDEPVFDPGPSFAAIPEESVAPLETMQPAVEARPLEPALDAQPAPAPSPFLRTPPSTPAERAAVFAGAFGKKPAAAQTPARARDASPAPEPPPSGPPGTEPTSNDAGLAVEAEPAPAQYEPENPHPALATIQIPPSLAHEPLPEIEMPPLMAPTEPLFGAESRDPHLDEPLISPAATAQPIVDPGPLESQDEAALFAGDPLDNMAAPANAGSAGNVLASLDALGKSEPVITSNGFDAAVTEEPESLGARGLGDLPPGMRAAMEQNVDESPDAFALPEDTWNGDLSSIDRERGVLSLDEAENEEGAPVLPPAADGFEGRGDMENDTGLDGVGASRSRKPALLDPAGEVADAESPISHPGKLPLGDTAEEMARTARLLGINFGGSGSTEFDVDQEMVQAAKDLGISFNEGEGSANPSGETDIMALEAQRLGISFRDGGTVSDTTEKPMIVRYMPVIMGIVIILFMLLLGATFTNDVIAWFVS